MLWHLVQLVKGVPMRAHGLSRNTLLLQLLVLGLQAQQVKDGMGLTWETKMMTAEPVVKPLITLCERKLERKPRRREAPARYISPANRDTCKHDPSSDLLQPP